MPEETKEFTAARRFRDGVTGEMVSVGDTLTLTADRARDMQRNGLLQDPNGPQETPTAGPEETKADQQKAADDLRLAPFAKAGGWYEFQVKDADPVKVQGRDAALAKLTELEAANVEFSQPASGQ